MSHSCTLHLNMQAIYGTPIHSILCNFIVALSHFLLPSWSLRFFGMFEYSLIALEAFQNRAVRFMLSDYSRNRRTCIDTITEAANCSPGYLRRNFRLVLNKLKHLRYITFIYPNLSMRPKALNALIRA